MLNRKDRKKFSIGELVLWEEEVVLIVGIKKLLNKADIVLQNGGKSVKGVSYVKISKI